MIIARVDNEWLYYIMNCTFINYLPPEFYNCKIRPPKLGFDKTKIKAGLYTSPEKLIIEFI